jgi:succinyl-diaminopimelate desuccinylase
MPDDRAAARINAFLKAERDRQAAFLAALVRAPSDNPPGDCAPHAEGVAALLEGLGLIVERHAVPEPLVRAHGLVSVTNLVVRHRFGPGPTVALNAHGDVVPPGEGWTRDPYGAEVADGWMYGRGAAVSKSDFATYTWALLALKASAAPLAGTVELHFTYEEESGGELGPPWLLSEGISKPDYAIGAGFSYAVVDAHNGCLHLEVDLRGRSAHAAKPWTGIDALEAAVHVLETLYAWRRGLAARVSPIPGIGSPQLTIGLISGGINTNVVPDRVVFRLDRRMVPEENPAEAEAELRHVIEGAARLPRRAGHGAPRPARRAADAASRKRAPERRALPLRQPRDGGAGRDGRRAALHRCAALRGAWGADRALRRWAAHHRRSERASRGRAGGAR